MVKLNQMFTPVLNDPIIPTCRREDCGHPAVVWGEDVPLCFEHAFEEATAAIFRFGREAAANGIRPRGVGFGTPPEGLRNHVCLIDGHEDPDRSGACLHCRVLLDA